MLELISVSILKTIYNLIPIGSETLLFSTINKNSYQNSYLVSSVIYLALCLVIFCIFIKKFIAIAKDFFIFILGNKNKSEQRKLLKILLITSLIPLIIYILLINNQIFNTQTLAIISIVFGLTFIILDKFNITIHDTNSIPFSSVLIIAIFACVIPVFSTISIVASIIFAGRLIGMERLKILELAYLMLFIWFFVLFVDNLTIYLNTNSTSLIKTDMIISMVAFIVSFLFGFFIITFFQKFFEKRKFIMLASIQIITSIVFLISNYYAPF